MRFDSARYSGDSSGGLTRENFAVFLFYREPRYFTVTVLSAKYHAEINLSQLTTIRKLRNFVLTIFAKKNFSKLITFSQLTKIGRAHV